ncbi:MAG: hypothetical protein HS130_11530 [Deltaproteobacteria bacterium]|nr:hypothetical protein [Deltaproteobacteria bacterium]
MKSSAPLVSVYDGFLVVLNGSYYYGGPGEIPCLTVADARAVHAGYDQVEEWRRSGPFMEYRAPPLPSAAAPGLETVLREDVFDCGLIGKVVVDDEDLVAVRPPTVIVSAPIRLSGPEIAAARAFARKLDKTGLLP